MAFSSYLSMYDYTKSIYKVFYDKICEKVYSNLYGTSSPNKTERMYPDISLLESCSSMLMDDPSYIVDNLYLGTAINAASEITLNKFNIKHIFNITSEISNYHNYKDSLQYNKYELYDNNYDSIFQHLEDTYNKIKNIQFNSSGNILVHCYMGRSRSASVIIYYIMREYGLHCDDSINFVKIKRPIINPTKLFKSDLINSYECLDNKYKLNNPDLIIDNIYIGNNNLINSTNFDMIINQDNDYFTEIINPNYKIDIDSLDKIYNLIKNKKILVNINTFKSPNLLILVYYIKKELNVDKYQALEHLKKIKPNICIDISSI